MSFLRYVWREYLTSSLYWSLFTVSCGVFWLVKGEAAVGVWIGGALVVVTSYYEDQ